MTAASDGPVNALSPQLAGRRPFVGREAQLQAMTAAVSAAELGDGVIILVAGEAGIGKTRLVTELASRVSLTPVRATCWEGDGAPAYWPWRQLIRGLASDFPYEVGEAVGRLESYGVTASGEDPQFELFDAIAGGLASVSRVQPLLLVLDDLHWADEETVRLLHFVVRDTRRRRLVIIGTYRDSDLDRADPLAARLAELVRDGLHLALGGLSPHDVAILVGARDPDLATPEAVARLHRQSGGNPFFLSELLKLRDSSSADPPPGVQAVVTRRLALSSASALDVLTAMSVLGTDVSPHAVGAVLDRSAASVLAGCAEAEAAGLATVTAEGRVAFVHDVTREVVYAGLDVAARTALHERAARVLEAESRGARAAEVAHHLIAAALGEPDERCVEWAVRAAEQSTAAAAYADAAHWYRRALRALSPSDPREARLLLCAGESSLTAGDLEQARAAYQRAAALARAADDAAGLAHAALGLGAGLGGFEVRLFDPVQIDLLEEALAAVGTEPSPLRAWLLARLSIAVSLVAEEARRQTLSAEAVEVARAIDDRRALGYALAASCDASAGPDSCEQRAAASGEIVQLGVETGDRQLELLGLRLLIMAALERGDVGAADVAIERYALLTERLRQPLYRWYVPLWRGMRALMRAEYDHCARHCAEAERIGAQATSTNAVVLTFTQWWVRQRYEGNLAEAGSAMASLLGDEAAVPRVTSGPRAVIAALLGDLGKARALLAGWLSAGLADRIRDSEWLPESAQLAQVAVAADAREVAERLYVDLRPYAHLYCVEGIGAAVTGSVAAYLAVLAQYLGRRAEAETYAAQARAAHARIGLLLDPPPMAATTSPAAPAPPPGPALVHEGPTWIVTWQGATGRVRDSKGLRDLAILLSQPHHDVHALELVGGSDVGGDIGPAIDPQARRAYEQRIRALQEDIDEARDLSDLGRAERAEEELDALVSQLAAAFGLSGRARGAGAAAERARSAVSWRIRAALRNVADAQPELGRHLRNAVRTGTWCSYRPETDVTWSIRSGRSA